MNVSGSRGDVSPLLSSPPVRVLRSLIIATALVVGVAAPVAAQTTTTSTMPPVRSIPVTPAQPATTTTTAATTATTAATGADGETAAGDPLADTGIAADKLVPLGFLLIAVGALLDAAARRYRRTAYSFF